MVVAPGNFGEITSYVFCVELGRLGAFGDDGDGGDLNYYLLPVLMVVLGSYSIADVFFDVYEMAVDTVFLCFLEDVERNDGSEERPYFMSK